MTWQKDWVNELYACDPKGNLRYRWSLRGIPKKNGKATIPAVIETSSGCWERPPSHEQQWGAWQDDQLGELLFGFRSGGTDPGAARLPGEGACEAPRARPRARGPAGDDELTDRVNCVTSLTVIFTIG